MMLLKKTLLISSTIYKTPSHPPHLLHLLRCFSASKTQNPDPKPNFMEGYLISSCGFPPETASKLAKRLNTLQSPDKPDSIIRFLKHHGFDHTHIRSLISRYPSVLVSDVETAAEPNLRALISIGFSGPELARVVIRNPVTLSTPKMVPKIEFWRSLFGNDEKKVRMAFERNRNLTGLDTARCITPKITLFKNYGLSDHQIQSLLLLSSEILTKSAASIEALLKWTLDMGFQSDSSMFVYGLDALARNGRALFEAKMELLMSYGWSEHEFLSAFQKSPFFAGFSQKSIRTKMEFLVGSAGCTASYIALHPLLLGYSLEKRLLPRHHVLQIVKAKELPITDFRKIMKFTDEMFLEKFVARYKEEVPELREIYTAACAGRFLGPYQDHLSQESS